MKAPVSYCTLSAAALCDPDATKRVVSLLSRKPPALDLYPCLHSTPCHDPNNAEMVALERYLQEQTGQSLCGLLGITL